METWRQHDITSSKEYLTFPPIEYFFPTKHSLKILCKSTHSPRRYKKNVSGCFFWTVYYYYQSCVLACPPLCMSYMRLCCQLVARQNPCMFSIYYCSNCSSSSCYCTAAAVIDGRRPSAIAVIKTRQVLQSMSVCPASGLLLQAYTPSFIGTAALYILSPCLPCSASL